MPIINEFRDFFFISLWFRNRIEELLGLNFGVGVVLTIETWCSYYICVVRLVITPLQSILDIHMYLQLHMHVQMHMHMHMHMQL